MKIFTRFQSLSLDIRIILGLVLLTLATRLYNLTVLPIFTDESIYIYWAKTIETSHSQWFISLFDGKPPLLIWVIAILLTIFPSNWYLIAGRLPSVIAGVIAVIGIYKLTYLLFKKRVIAVIASLMYIIFPFNLMYDRMALFDSMLTAMLVWSVYFCIKTTETFSLKDACIWGFFLGLGFLSKATALFIAVATPICFLILTFQTGKWRKIAFLCITAFVTGEIMNNSLRISRSFHQMIIKNQQFQISISEFLNNPFEVFGTNIHLFLSWILAYYTLPVFIVGCIAFFILILKNFKTGLILAMLWIAPMLGMAILGRQVFPRYILLVTPYFIIATSYFLYFIFTKITVYRYVFPVIIFFLFFMQLKFDYFILNDPPKASFPQSDYNQYISDHPSGYGLKPIFDYLDKESSKKPIIIITQGTFGLFPYAFNLYYWDSENVKIIPHWPLNNIDQNIYDMHFKNTVFIVFKEHKYVPKDLPLKTILREEKPNGKDYPIILATFF